MGEEEEQVLWYAKAIYDYSDEYLSFFVNDTATVVEDYGDGWWRGYLPNDVNSGRIPANYFEIMDNTSSEYTYIDSDQYQTTHHHDDGDGGEGGDDQGSDAVDQNTTYSPNEVVNNGGGEAYDDGGSTASTPRGGGGTYQSFSTSPTMQHVSSSGGPGERYQNSIDETRLQPMIEAMTQSLTTKKNEMSIYAKQEAELIKKIEDLRKEVFFYKQLDFLQQEVLKVQTELDSDLYASQQLQSASLGVLREMKNIREAIFNVKVDAG
eukprot:TRINITY_DN3391_c0_g1_i2.p1 TRINITY_DN3391_c0_g1~~TRINITY_DN3391_c0_g1_i2.p1  ORF type:complete len:265 (-),score=80.44 TRINITY_DN3391_c0_g1_i2:162-956(-)